ncbi:hypothetical protein Tco_0825284 [Tanacetum coccineum]
MLDSKAYKQYYAVASGAELPKAKTKYKKKADEAVTPSKSKSALMAKGTRLKTPGKVTQSGDRADTQSKVPDEQQQKDSGTDEGAGGKPEVSDVPKYDSECDEESRTFSQDEEDVDEETYVNDDSEETESDNDGDDITHLNLVSTPPQYEITEEEEEEENKEGDDKDMEGVQEQDNEDDLYRDVNINLERSNAEMTDAQANKDIEDAHVTLTAVP